MSSVWINRVFNLRERDAIDKWIIQNMNYVNFGKLDIIGTE